MMTSEAFAERKLRIPISESPSALVGVDFDVECPFPSGAGTHVKDRVVIGAYASGKPRAVQYMCLGCWVRYIYQPVMGISTPMRVYPESVFRTPQKVEEAVVEHRARRPAKSYSAFQAKRSVEEFKLYGERKKQGLCVGCGTDEGLADMGSMKVCPSCLAGMNFSGGRRGRRV